MAVFKETNNQNNISGSGRIIRQSEIRTMELSVKANVTIPMYFYNIVVPQLGNYYDTYPVNFDIDPRACCCLHDVDSPSFRYYEDTSSFYCFGCNKGGNIINLHMYFAEKMNGKRPSKEEAIAFLYQYFVKGKYSETFIDKSAQTIDIKEKLNTDIEIVKFNIYRVNLEKSITFDKSISLSVKKQLWELLDSVDMLLSKDLIKASNAENYIKHRVRELITLETTSIK